MNQRKMISATKYKNKQRYKDKSKIVQKVEKGAEKSDKDEDKIVIEDDSRFFQRRKLESNWYRYEHKEDETEDRSKDFSLALSASQGGYFQFKSDKTLSKDIESKHLENKLFHIDLNLLNKSILTIPFHVRCGIDEKYFSDGEINEMNLRAKENDDKYKQYLNEEYTKLNSMESNEAELVDDVNVDLPNSDDVSALQNNMEKIEVKENHSPNMEKKTNLVSKSDGNDLEEWLDDILDD